MVVVIWPMAEADRALCGQLPSQIFVKKVFLMVTAFIFQMLMNRKQNGSLNIP